MYQCPKCGGSLDIVLNNETRLDRCVSCGGFWFDKGELVQLLTTEVDLTIDGSISTESEKLDKEEGFCPLCNGSKLKSIDSDVDHIHFDICPECKGIWLDKGELTSLVVASKKGDIIDLIKRSSE